MLERTISNSQMTAYFSSLNAVVGIALCDELEDDSNTSEPMRARSKLTPPVDLPWITNSSEVKTESEISVVRPRMNNITILK